MPFYNVENSVGKWGVNNPEDVMLVQFFLSEVAKVPPLPLPPPSTPLTVNGIASPTLNEWILWFQNATKTAGKVIIVDGKIDPAMIYNGSRWGGQGTIVHMNAAYRNRFRAAHNSLETASNCPGPLAAKFASFESNPN